MVYRSHPLCLTLCFLTMLSACAVPTKKRDVMDLYELPHTNTSRPMPVDNDSYYTSPGTYQGCTMINDAPACGGG